MFDKFKRLISEDIKDIYLKLKNNIRALTVTFGKKLSKSMKETAEKVKKDRRFIGKIMLNYAAPTVMIITLAVTVSYWSNKDFGLTVKYKGETMATIENEAVLEKANEMLNSQRAVPGEGTEIALTYEITPVDSQESCVPVSAVYNKLINMNGKLADNAVGLFVDGNFIGAATDDALVKSLLAQNLMEQESQQPEFSKAEYANEFQYASGIYPSDSVYTPEELVDMAIPQTKVIITTQSSQEEEIPYSVVYKETEDEYDGYESMTCKGENGTQTVTTQYRYINGELIGSEIVDVTVTKEAVDEVITVGIKPIPDKGVGTGTLSWPSSYTTNITSYFGYRWGKLHKGLDISGNGCYGTDILAADGGVVSFSGYDTGGYGYCIIIDHGNGMKTRYAHCSELYVSTGTPVGKGQAIAAIGSTGNSTGAHLHFEVIVNGSVVDPSQYF